MTPRVSVIVVARNERQRLPACIEALRNQTYAGNEFEIIVVDDGSTDDTLAWARGQADLRTVSVSEADSYRARNAGASQSASALLAFTDAHCIVQEDWLENLLDAFGDDTIGAVIGTLTYRDDASLLVKLYGKYHQTKMTYIHSRGIDDARFCHAANIAIRKSLFDACAGFRALPLPGDTDLLHRIITEHSQWRVHYADDAVVSRQSTLTLRDLLGNTIRHARLNDRMTAVGRFRALSWRETRAVFSACRRQHALSLFASAALVATLLVTTLAYSVARWQQRLSA